MFSTYSSRTWWLLVENWFKNFVKPYHEELSSKTWSMWQHHIPPNSFFWKLKVIIRSLSCWQQDFYFWQVLKSIHNFIIDALQYLFVRDSNKKQRRAIITSNFTKRGKFHLLWQPSALRTNLIMWPSSCTLEKGLSLPFSLAKKRIYLDTQLKGKLMDLFLKLPGRSLFPQVE